MNKFMCYRVYTETKQVGKLIKLANKLFPGYTLYHATGYWKEQNEKSTIFEIIGEKNIVLSDNVYRFAERIKEINNQESVLITSNEITTKFI